MIKKKISQKYFRAIFLYFTKVVKYNSEASLIANRELFKIKIPCPMMLGKAS
jgi:hypothetical protein